LGGQTEEEETAERRLNSRTRQDIADEYRARVNAALKGRRLPPR
jgi:hypothetical protein